MHYAYGHLNRSCPEAGSVDRQMPPIRQIHQSSASLKRNRHCFLERPHGRSGVKKFRLHLMT